MDEKPLHTNHVPSFTFIFAYKNIWGMLLLKNFISKGDVMCGGLQFIHGRESNDLKYKIQTSAGDPTPLENSKYQVLLVFGQRLVRKDFQGIK